MAQSICFYFQIHQPFRIRPQGIREFPQDTNYFDYEDAESNHAVFEKVSRKCYLPTTDVLIELCKHYPEFNISFSLSGVFMEQCELFGDTGKKVLQNFKTLAELGQTEFLAETYYHSLSFLYSKLEFAHQVQMQRDLIYKHFKQKPQVLRNTELIYRDDLGEFARLMGYRAVMAEGWPSALSEDNPNLIHWSNPLQLGEEDALIAQKYKRDKRQLPVEKMPILSKNFKLSDDIAFRFGDASRSNLPLNADTFIQWVTESPGDTINLFMDFETFGEHQWEDTGIFEFLKHLPNEALKKGVQFRTPSQTIKTFPAQGKYHAPEFISWADEERDISAWLENDMQRTSFDELKNFEAAMHPFRNKKNKSTDALWSDFRKLQTSDHLYYMSTKFWADGDVHTYFSPYNNPYDAYINFMNTLNHLKTRLDALIKKK